MTNEWIAITFIYDFALIVLIRISSPNGADVPWRSRPERPVSSVDHRARRDHGLLPYNLDQSLRKWPTIGLVSFLVVALQPSLFRNPA
jgi:hypothetical protein